MTEQSAVELLEQSAAILKSAPFPLLGTYFLGSVPFIIAFLYFLADMTKGAFAASYCAQASLCIAGAYLWMKWWHRRFCLLSIEIISKNKTRSGTLADYIYCIVVQSFGLFLMPIAALLTFALPAMYGFCAYACMVGKKKTLGLFLQHCYTNALLWQKQAIVLLGILMLLWFVLFVNTVIVFSSIPYAMAKLFALTTVESGTNSTFSVAMLVIAALLVSWAMIDPLMKIAYCLRYYHAASLKNGRDILETLHELQREKPASPHLKGVMVCCIVVAAIGTLLPGEPDASTHPMDSNIVINSEKLEEIISSVIVKPDYSWRLPHKVETKAQPKKSFITTLTESAVRSVKFVGRHIAQFVKKILKWFLKITRQKSTSGTAEIVDWMKSVNGILLIILGCLSVLFLIWIFVLKMRKPAPVIPATDQASLHALDLENENISADALPVDEWLKRARSFLEQKQHKAAIRAFFLSTLATLSENRLLTLGIDKSNKEYQRQVSILSRRVQEIFPAFSQMVLIFEMIWYGNFQITETVMKEFILLNEQIRGYANQ
ncbi:MAG: hypothetical protein JW795_19730 [Chitinivibrionales bacterium]|nr:hypothetical protein [Chitinivibrionales bacterium]